MYDWKTPEYREYVQVTIAVQQAGDEVPPELAERAQTALARAQHAAEAAAEEWHG